MRDLPFTVTVHCEGGRTTTSDHYTRKAARHHARQACGRTGVERITLDGPGVVACELWSKADGTPVAPGPVIAFHSHNAPPRRIA